MQGCVLIMRVVMREVYVFICQVWLINQVTLIRYLYIFINHLNLNIHIHKQSGGCV